jgi:exodeoxyribonuclease VIII
MGLGKLENSGKRLKRTIISKPQQKRVENWVKGYRKNETAVKLVDPCESELSLFGELEGVKIKVRADSLNVEGGYIGDVKTTAYDTDVDSFKQTVEDFGYDLSACLYAEMFEKHYGKKFDFYFIVLGKKDCSCEVFKLSEESRKKGRGQIKKALALYKKCLKSGVWESPKQEGYMAKEYDDYEILEV